MNNKNTKVSKEFHAMFKTFTPIDRVIVPIIITIIVSIIILVGFIYLLGLYSLFIFPHHPNRQEKYL